MEADPIGLAGDLALFIYSNNNPNNWKDIFGLKGFPNMPTGGCEYYKDRCGETDQECNAAKDDYACKAYDCCKAFGEGPISNCIRGCLITFDKMNCAQLSGEDRKKCRRIQHWDCYDRCNDHILGGKNLLPSILSGVGLPNECIDAMEEIGGMLPW